MEFPWPSISGDAPIGARICRSCQHAIAVAGDRPGMTGYFIVGANQFNVMTALFQIGNRGRRNSAFELECIAVLPPSSAEQPAGGRDGLLQRLFEPDHT